MVTAQRNPTTLGADSPRVAPSLTPELAEASGRKTREKNT